MHRCAHPTGQGFVCGAIATVIIRSSDYPLSGCATSSACKAHENDEIAWVKRNGHGQNAPDVIAIRNDISSNPYPLTANGEFR